MDGLIKKLLGLLKLMLLQVDTAQVVHAASLLLPVLQLFENLVDLVVVEQGLVVVAFMTGVPRHVDGLGQVAESEVERVDLVVPRPVVQHDVGALVLLLLLVGFPAVLLAESMLLVELLFFLLVRADDHLDLVIQFYDRLRDLRGDLAQAVGGDQHHDG